MQTDLIACKNCGNPFQGKYCNRCGEKVYAEKDKKVSHFFVELFHFITHLEGTLFTTLGTMFTRPGKLSLDICNGIRKRYFKPLSLFLILVIIYLLFPYVEGLNMQMKYYPNLFGEYASNAIKNAATNTGLNETDLAELFRQKSEKISKFLLIILIPLAALFFKLILWRRKKYFFDYLVYSAEINSVYLFWGYLVLGLAAGVLHIPIPEKIFGLVMIVPVAFYVAVSANRFFHLKWWQSILISILFLFVYAVIIIQFIYKLILFFITINLLG